MNKAVIVQLSADLLRLLTSVSTALVSQNPVRLSTVLWTASVSRNKASAAPAPHHASLP